MFLDQGNQTGVGLGLGEVVLDAVLADVEVDFSGSAADVAEVGVGHFPGAVYDAAHNGELHALEVAGLGADALGRRLEIKERTTTAGTRDKFGLRDASAGALEDVVGELERAGDVGFGFDADEVADAVAEEAAVEERGFEEF